MMLEATQKKQKGKRRKLLEMENWGSIHHSVEI